MGMTAGVPRKPQLPTCIDCGKRADRSRRKANASPQQMQGSVPGGYDWLCAACEYKREFPDAEPIIAHPEMARALPLQSERLFEV